MPNHERKLRGLKTTALIAVGAATLSACGPERAPTPIPEPTSEHTTNIQERKDRPAEFQKLGGEAVKEIIAILDDPENGATVYWANNGGGWMVGNKEFLVGPDEEWPTADDGKRSDGAIVPEAFVGAEDGVIYLSAITGEELSGETIFNDFLVEVSIAGSDKIMEKLDDPKATVTLEDFKQALAGIGDGGASIIKLTGSTDAGYTDEGKDLGSSYTVKVVDGEIKGAIDRGLTTPGEYGYGDELGTFTETMAEQIGKKVKATIANMEGR